MAPPSSTGIPISSTDQYYPPPGSATFQIQPQAPVSWRPFALKRARYHPKLCHHPFHPAYFGSHQHPLFSLLCLLPSSSSSRRGFSLPLPTNSLSDPQLQGGVITLTWRPLTRTHFASIPRTLPIFPTSHSEKEAERYYESSAPEKRRRRRGGRKVGFWGGGAGMETYLNQNFGGVKSKNSSAETLE